MNQELIYLALAVIAVLFLLLQWFMSERPWFLPGLVLPLMFAVAWFCITQQPLALIKELGLTDHAVRIMSTCCLVGFVASLVLYIICRLLRNRRLQKQEARREARLEAKRQRLLKETALLDQAASDRPPLTDADIAEVEKTIVIPAAAVKPAAPAAKAPAPAAAPTQKVPAPAAAPAQKVPAPATAPAQKIPAPAAAPAQKIPAPAAAPAQKIPAPAAQPITLPQQEAATRRLEA